MAVDMYQTGVSGLLAAQAQLATTGHNIANVNTEGFSRQR
ncbi:MAG: flagellar basal body protein, partial [Candidatus Oceanisphaera merdipullorum]|nr:flagellar basal body protein [Candidatus Oceanisphaera merdipullorum]